MEKAEIGKMAQTALSGAHFRPLMDVLIKSHGRTPAESLSEAICSRLVALLEENQGVEPMLFEEARDYILPSIAIYEALRRESGQEAALAQFREMFFQAAYGGAARLRERAEDATFRRGLPHSALPPREGAHGGFVFRIVRDGADGSEYHVLRCPYVEFCARYGCEELATTFCDCDDIIYGDIHPKLVWARSKTIGRGQELCDFKFILMEDIS